MDFNSGKAGDALAKVQGELDEVKTVMLENIERVLERGDKIELLVESTARLQSDAAAFRSTTRRVARRMWWNNAKMFFISLVRLRVCAVPHRGAVLRVGPVPVLVEAPRGDARG